MANLSDAQKDFARKALSDVFRQVEEGFPSTLIVTTDGERYSIRTVFHPLPDRYLKQWEEDRLKYNVNMNLGGEDCA